MKLYHLGLLLLLAPAPAVAETWRAASGANGARAYIDVDSITRDGDRVFFLREVRWPEPMTLQGGLRIDRILARYEGDCRANTLRALSLTAKLGAAVIASNDKPDEIERAEPGTAGGDDLRSACFNEWPRE
ncbi:MAG TPA: surface-adhesin E family protein [Allosphingosinicella sp.]|jgi:hypothetical protein